jgi:sugar lactone lactonase YvrE
MEEPRTLLDGLSFPESPRWHAERLWVCDWGAEELLAVGLDGTSEVLARVPSFPFCIDWLPDGRLLIVNGRERTLLTLDDAGALRPYADLRPLADGGWNEIVVAGRGRVYVNGGGSAPGEDYRPGMIALVAGDGSTRPVAGEIAFPNGMTVTPDDSTLIVAESYASQLTAFDIDPDGGLSNRRVWAHIEGSAPDGICIDAEGAVWYADVPNRRCTRVREGGEVLQEISLDRGCFSCALGGEDGRTLFIVTREWRGVSSMSDGERTGQVLMTTAPAPAGQAPTGAHAGQAPTGAHAGAHRRRR